MDWIIGGQPMLGRGWRMLMECLAAGRGISLPSSATGMAKLAVRAVGGYARVRQQFKTPIGKFEGIEEALTRMGGNLYMMDATRMLTAAAIDLKQKPAVISGITKLHLTERGRQVVVDGMDVLGGKGICMGPANFLGAAYMQTPVAITVEGANILTRSLIVFGQGAIRCHPFVLKEIAATREPDSGKASIDFDAALFGHLRFTVSNLARTFVMGLTGSHFVRVPDAVAPETRRYYQQLTRFSAALAFLADLSMGTLGGALKRKEKLSARLGDILSLMYLCSATLRRYEADGRQHADAPLMHWAMWDAMFKAQNAFEGVISNFPNRFIASVMRRVVFPLGRPYVIPSDKLGHDVARLLIEPSETRDRLTAGVYLSQSSDNPLAQIERSLAAAIAAEPIEAKLRAAIKAGRIDAKLAPGDGADALDARAVDAGVITAAEAAALSKARELAADVIRVDDFAQDLGASDFKPAPAAVQVTASPSVIHKAKAACRAHQGHGQLQSLALAQQHGQQLAPTRNEGGQRQLLGIGQRADEMREVGALHQHRRECGQHARVDAVGLGELAHGLGEVARLFGIDDCHRQASRLQRAGQRRFVTAGGLHDHQGDPQRRQRRRQRRVSLGLVDESLSVEQCAQHRDIDLCFGHVDADHH